jgi:hypothetical protein
VKAYKYNSYFCTMCSLFNCSMHFIESSDYMYNGAEFDIQDYGYYRLEDLYRQEKYTNRNLSSMEF